MPSEPPPSTPSIARFERLGWELWLAPSVAAAVWGVLVARADGDLALARSLVFIGGPLVLLAGLFERTGSYLHAPHRQQLLPLPLPPAQHFAAAARPHRVGLLASAALGTAALGLALAADLGRTAPTPTVLLLLVDWLWLVAIAALTEPAIAGAAAWLGRRFDEDTPVRRLQRSVGGGWTLPEAVVHLYAPAVGIGAAALLAMPAQLTCDRLADAMATGAGVEVVTSAAWGATLSGLVGAVALRMWAQRGYAAGMFEATAWLAQATRTLAGPPVPEPAPRWIAGISDPALRLWLLQLWRVTPVPGLRIGALVGVGAWLGVAGAIGVPHVAVLLALTALWLVPAIRVAQLRPRRAALLGALPLPEAARQGRCPAAAWVLAAPPVVALALALTGAALSDTPAADAADPPSSEEPR